MSSLLKKTFFRVIAFILASSIGAIVFSSLERSHAKNELKTKEKLLESLRKEMGLKYNMTQVDFENFSQLSHDALSLGGPAWDYLDGLRFAFETLTTIGKRLDVSMFDVSIVAADWQQLIRLSF